MSLLSTGSPEVYAGRGWHPVPTAQFEAEFPSGDIEWAGGYVVRPFEAADLAAVMGIYRDIAADRVGPLDRSEAYWLSLMEWLPSLSQSADIHFDVLVQVRSVVAYAITELSDDALTILDGGIQSENLAIPLLNAWRDRAAVRGVSRRRQLEKLPDRPPVPARAGRREGGVEVAVRELAAGKPVRAVKEDLAANDRELVAGRAIRVQRVNLLGVGGIGQEEDEQLVRFGGGEGVRLHGRLEIGRRARRQPPDG